MIWFIYHSDPLLDLGERAQLEEARLAALQGFDNLSADAAVSGKWRFKMRPKFHTFDHALRRAVRTGCNLSMTWSFSKEYWLGQQCLMV